LKDTKYETLGTITELYTFGSPAVQIVASVKWDTSVNGLYSTVALRSVDKVTSKLQQKFTNEWDTSEDT